MTELTAEKIRLVMLAVQAMRITGRIEPGAQVSHRKLERISYRIGEPVSREEFARAEARALHKARLAALAIKARRNSSTDH
jgi:hypothetical protein